MQLDEVVTMSLWMVNVPPPLHATSPSGAALAAIGAAENSEVSSRRQVAATVFFLFRVASDLVLLVAEQSVAGLDHDFSERPTFETAMAFQEANNLAIANARGSIIRTFLTQESTTPRLINAG
jgi:hypothetical protein